MSDSGKGPGFASEVMEGAQELIKETFGDLSLSGVSKSPEGSTPQINNPDQKTPEERAQLAKARVRLNTLAQEQAVVRQNNQQHEIQRQQVQAQEAQARANNIPQFGTQPAGMRNDIAETRSELRAGRKGG